MRPRPKHYADGSQTPSHPGDFGVTWSPDEAWANDSELPGITFCEAVRSALLLDLGDSVGSHFARLLEEGGVFIQDTIGLGPVVDNKAADLDETLHRRVGHRSQEPFRGEDSLVHLWRSTFCPCDREMNCRVDVVE